MSTKPPFDPAVVEVVELYIEASRRWVDRRGSGGGFTAGFGWNEISSTEFSFSGTDRCDANIDVGRCLFIDRGDPLDGSRFNQLDMR